MARENKKFDEGPFGFSNHAVIFAFSVLEMSKFHECLKDIDIKRKMVHPIILLS
ncbi:hypothetical protein Hdeb2414_s0026g00680471 [Helianthus debilis subsp. tardiflorus]